MKKLSEVAKLVGLLRQRIQEYEKAGIAFKPKVKNSHGDWLYGEAEIERLWQIKFYLTLGLTVPKMKAIFADPNYNKHEAIEAQIIELEEQKKKLESMIEIARVYNEMEILPSDLCGQDRNALENIPYEAAVPIVGKIFSLLWAEAKSDDEFCDKWDEFKDSLYKDFLSEKDEEQWVRAIGKMAWLHQKGVSYKEQSVQRQVDVVHCIDSKVISDSFMKRFWRCKIILDEAEDPNGKSIKEAFGEDCFQYINDAIDYYYIKYFENNPDTLYNFPIVKTFINIEQLGRRKFTTGSDEVQSEVKKLHELMDDFGIFSKAAQLELLSSISSSIGCKSTREVFDNGRDHGICWFISRAIEIYCNHQREAIGEKEENNE